MLTGRLFIFEGDSFLDMFKFFKIVKGKINSLVKFFMELSWILIEVACFAVGLFFLVEISLDFKKDVLLYTNSAFVVCLGLASLSYNLSRAIKEDERSDKIQYAGERLTHGAVLFILASLLNFLNSHWLAELSPYSNLYEITGWIINIIGALIYLVLYVGLMSANAGIIVLHRDLLANMHRRKEMIDYM
ncbi:MAG: hypothetical protein H6853_07310 [Rhodospirillales bacterium]|nr:hypothetical protein [Alphaproteobacteria bacterium]USO03336.1 MAG: hypothetical protein H6853_07310 [Rhodospirillales bacterium]